VIEQSRSSARRRPTGFEKVDFSDLTPDVDSYLGQAAYVQLGFFQVLSELSVTTSDLGAKQIIAQAAGFALAKHEGIVSEIVRREKKPDEAMAPFAPAVDEFLVSTAGATKNEALLSVYITQGFLDDLYIGLTDGLPSDVGPRIASLLGSDSGANGLVALLTDAIDVDPKRADFLAMWGRRLVGDTLLLAHHALRINPGSATEEARVEPVFTELIATHTRRMDALGLTA
jgi:hypothetical protein